MLLYCCAFVLVSCSFVFFFFFFNDTATTEIYTLSLHDALPICDADEAVAIGGAPARESYLNAERILAADRKSTRLNSSHLVISYAVFCLKKKKKKKINMNKLRETILS